MINRDEAKRLRESSGVTQRAIAKMALTSQSAVCNFEKGLEIREDVRSQLVEAYLALDGSVPSIEDILTRCKALGISQRRLAQRAGVCPESITRMVTSNKATNKMLVRLYEALASNGDILGLGWH